MKEKGVCRKGEKRVKGWKEVEIVERGLGRRSLIAERVEELEVWKRNM